MNQTGQPEKRTEQGGQRQTTISQADRRGAAFRIAAELALVFLCTAEATALGQLFRAAGFPETNVVLAYVLGVVVAARFCEHMAVDVLASLLATMAFNYFFTSPYFSLRVYDLSYLITFAVMTAVSLMTSALTAQAKRNAREAARRSAEVARVQEESERERYRGNLLRAISHDLRTPLSGIMGTCEMILDMSLPEDPRYTLTKGIWKDADWLHALVENILSLTRIEDGRLSLKKQPEAAEEIVGSALSHIEKRAPEREIAVSVPDEVLMVPMDAKLIEQVLVNLLDNAVKHTPPEREIAVVVTREDDKAVFRVRDRGEGIRPEDLPHIFERFYTVGKGGADAGRGVGLGLAICEAIVRAHGGEIAARNREGGGAEFWFSLPLEQ